MKEDQEILHLKVRNLYEFYRLNLETDYSSYRL